MTEEGANKDLHPYAASVAHCERVPRRFCSRSVEPVPSIGQLIGDSQYHLYGMGALAKPFLGTVVYELTKWVGLLVWVVYPTLLGLYCARKVLRRRGPIVEVCVRTAPNDR